MPYSIYPTEADLASRLKADGVSPETIAAFQDGGMLLDATQSAVSDWEDATNWHPYLAGSPAPRLFDAPLSVSGGRNVPGSRVDLDAPLLSLMSVACGGRVLTADRDFFAAPRNAPAADKPYLWITFAVPPAGSVVITGRWGRVAVIPDNVWDAIISQAHNFLAPDLALAGRDRVTEKTIAGATLKFTGAASDKRLDLQSQLRQSRWERLVKNNKRVVF